MEKVLTQGHRWVFSALLCAALAVCLVYREKRDSGHLGIFFLDVGQGDSIYIRTPGNRDMLIDGGPSGAVLRRLSSVMPWYDRSIDVIVETHPDLDHIGGLPEVFERYRVGVFLEPGVESENAADDELDKVRQEKGVRGIVARKGMRINFGDGASFDILFPDTDVSRFETNTASIVGMLRYGSTSAMLTGDSPKSIENQLVALYGGRLKSDVLKAGHHGSRTSSGNGFVSAVAPKYAVISAGADNRYGHPHQEVLDTFESLGAKILSTAEMGTVELVSDGESFLLK